MVFALTMNKVLEVRRAWCVSLLTVMLKDGVLLSLLELDSLIDKVVYRRSGVLRVRGARCLMF